MNDVLRLRKINILTETVSDKQGKKVYNIIEEVPELSTDPIKEVTDMKITFTRRISKDEDHNI